MTVLANVALAVLGFVTGMLGARLLGPEGRGELAAIQLWPSLISTLAMLGLPEALVYFSAKDPTRAGRYTGSAVSLALLSSLVFIAASYFLMPLLLAGQADHIVGAARWYLLLGPLYALVGMPFHALRGRQDFGRWNALRLLPSLAWLLVLALAWAIGRAEARWVAGAYLISLALLFFPITVVVRSRIAGPYSPDPRDWYPLIRFGAPSAACAVPQMLNHRLDQLILAAFLPARALGLYVVAVAWGNMVVPFLSALGTVAGPRVAAEPDGNRQRQIVGQAGRLAVLASVSIGAPVLAVTPWGLPLVFGAQFREAVPAAAILVVAGIVSGVNQVLEDALRGLGRPTAVLKAELAGALVAALSLSIMLPRAGAVGAALASLVGYSGAAGCLIWSAKSAPTRATTQSTLRLPDSLRGISGQPKPFC